MQGLGEVEARKQRAIDRRVEFVYHFSKKQAPSTDKLRARFGQ